MPSINATLWPTTSVFQRAVLAIVAVLVLSNGLASTAAYSQEVPAALEGYSTYVEQAMQDWQVPGIAIAVVQDRQVVYSEGFGYRDVDAQEPVTPQTLFAIGSSSKAFTAMTLAILVDEGTISWNEPVIDYLPNFRLKDDYASRQMTPVDLLSHQSGLPRHDLLWYGADFTREEMIERLRYLEPSETFRDRFQYQNLMYLTAGYLAEQVTGSSWEELVQQNIFEPLRMERSNFSVDRMQQMSNHALPYGGGRDSLERMDFRNIDAIGPAGSINSSVEEMAEWVKLQLGDGTYGGDRIVSEENLRLMHSPQKVIEQWSMNITEERSPYIMYGLGWFLQPYQGHRLMHHGGNIDGFAALVGFLPDDEIGFVILTNKNGTPVPNILMYDLIDRMLGYDDTPDWNEHVVSLYEEREEESEDEEEEDPRVEGTEPSHELSAYAGSYEHPGYGTLHIEHGEDSLRLQYNAFDVPVEHYHYDVFEVQGEQLEGTKVQFYGNVEGDIDRVALPLEGAVDDIVFERTAPEEFAQADYLQQFAGEYEVEGDSQTITVRLRADDTLTLSVPGQPTYELVPKRENEFGLKDMSGFNVQFEELEGQITQVVFHQPNGRFTAVRR